MKRTNIIHILIFLILCLFLSVLVFLRWQAKEESAVPVNAKTAPPAIPSLILSPIPTPTPAHTLSPLPTPKSVPAPSPVLTPEPAFIFPPLGYTEESYNLVSDMVYAYADRQDAAADMIQYPVRSGAAHRARPGSRLALDKADEHLVLGQQRAHAESRRAARRPAGG